MKYLFVLAFMFFGLVSTANAAAIGNKGVQVMEYVYDFSREGGAVGFIDLSTRLNAALPSGASILRIHYYVQTALNSENSGGSATLAVGDAGSNARYLSATAYDNAAWADEKLDDLSTALPHQVASANAGKFGVTVGTADLTAGKISFLVEYVQIKR